ncbi:MAG: TatD family hydrolase [Selenomonadaceae bacterium]
MEPIEKRGIVLVDTHCHIDGPEYDDDREAMLERARAAEVTRIVNFGDTMESSARSVKLADTHEMVYVGVGIHPENVTEMTQADDDKIAEWAKDEKVVAIGEIGLDYYWEKDPENHRRQKALLVHQLDIARQLHLPVCIHDREAHGDMMKILRSEGRGIPGVIHCYSGSWEMAKELIKLGYFLGIDGPIMYKNAVNKLDIIKNMPADRILTETDSPYLTPLPYRGRRNEPMFVRRVAEFAAELRGETIEEFAKQTTENAVNLYGIKL